MSRVRAVFMGTPDIARYCLEALIKDEHFEVVGVVSQPDRPAGRKMQLQPSPVKTLALAHNIATITPENVNADEALAQIAAFKAEVAIVVAFGQILKKPLLAMFPAKVVNLHASLLPRLRGAAPIQRALIEGDKKTGICLQVMVRKLDAGPILGAREFAISDEMTAFESYALCQSLGAKLLEVELMDYVRGNLTPQPQDETAVTYAAKIEKDEGRMDWSSSARSLHNLVRGLAMGPQAFTAHAGKTLKIHRTRIAAEGGSGPAGRVVKLDPLTIQCGSGTLELVDVQRESRAKSSAAEYLRGYPMSLGDAFE